MALHRMLANSVRLMVSDTQNTAQIDDVHAFVRQPPFSLMMTRSHALPLYYPNEQTSFYAFYAMRTEFADACANVDSGGAVCEHIDIDNDRLFNTISSREEINRVFNGNGDDAFVAHRLAHHVGGEPLVGLLSSACRFEERFAQRLLDNVKVAEFEKHLASVGLLEHVEKHSERFNLQVLQQRLDAIALLVHQCLTRHEHERARVLFLTASEHLTGEPFAAYQQFVQESILNIYE